MGLQFIESLIDLSMPKRPWESFTYRRAAGGAAPGCFPVALLLRSSPARGSAGFLWLNSSWIWREDEGAAAWEVRALRGSCWEGRSTLSAPSTRRALRPCFQVHYAPGGRGARPAAANAPESPRQELGDASCLKRSTSRFP